MHRFAGGSAPLLLGVVLAACATSPSPVPAAAVPETARQIVLVTTDGWDSTDAQLQKWERDDGGRWHAVGAASRATVGRSGLGWGLGRHHVGAGPQKREGDGRAPAGVFTLGPAFGYDAVAPDGVRVRYRAADERDYFVDDVESSDYNRWRRIPEGSENDPKARWGSCERMRRDDDQYELGMVVQHNDACVKGRGSAIFLHVWSAPGAPTSGCTAMSRADLLALLRWLDPAANPLLMQAPEAHVGALRLAGEGR